MPVKTTIQYMGMPRFDFPEVQEDRVQQYVERLISDHRTNLDGVLSNVRTLDFSEMELYETAFAIYEFFGPGGAPGDILDDDYQETIVQAMDEMLPFQEEGGLFTAVRDACEMNKDLAQVMNLLVLEQWLRDSD